MTMHDNIWLDDTSEDHDGFMLCRADKKYGNVDIEFVRADLTPQWRPIGEWDGVYRPLMAFATDWGDGKWELVASGKLATHFMQLTPPND